MSATDFDRQIAAEQSRIAALRKEISELNEEIDGLRKFTGDLDDIQEKLQKTASRASGRLQEITEIVIGAVKSLVRQEFFADIQERAMGADYRSANTGLDESREITAARIREDEKKVESRQDQIAVCRRRIDQLERDREAARRKELLELAEPAGRGQ